MEVDAVASALSLWKWWRCVIDSYTGHHRVSGSSERRRFFVSRLLPLSANAQVAAVLALDQFIHLFIRLCYCPYHVYFSIQIIFARKYLSLNAYSIRNKFQKLGKNSKNRLWPTSGYRTWLEYSVWAISEQVHFTAFSRISGRNSDAQNPAEPSDPGALKLE